MKPTLHHLSPVNTFSGNSYCSAVRSPFVSACPQSGVVCQWAGLLVQHLACPSSSGRRTSDSLTHGSDCFQLFCASQPNSDFRLHFCWIETDGMCMHPILLSEHDIYFQPRDSEGNTRTLLRNASKVSSSQELVRSYNDSSLIPAGLQFECRSLCRLCRVCVHFPQSTDKNAHIVPGIWPRNSNSPSIGMGSRVMFLV